MATLLKYGTKNKCRHRPQQKELVRAPSFCTRAEKVTVWAHALKKSVVRRLLTASVWSMGRASIGQEERGEKKEKRIPHYTWEGWVMESCPHVLFRGGLFHLQSKWPACSLAYMLWLRASQRAEKERGECDIDVTASRGWMNHSSNNGAPVTEVLSAC